MRISSVADTLWQHVLLTLSPEHAQRVAQEYWRNAAATHGSMDQADFDHLCGELGKLIGPVKGLTLLDYGAGGGQVAAKFQSMGARVEAQDASEHFVEEMRRTGIEAHLGTVPAGRQYDVVLMNCAFYYVHPTAQPHLLGEFFRLTTPGGSVFITDNPDSRKRGREGALPADGLHIRAFYYALTAVFPVYQPALAGRRERRLRVAALGRRDLPRVVHPGT